MIRGLNIILLIACISSLAGVYAIKYETLELANQIAALKKEGNSLNNDISLLEADWAYFNQPSYIEPVVRRHQEKLELNILNQDQFININDIPMRVEEDLDDKALTALFEALDRGIDPIAVLIEANSQ